MKWNETALSNLKTGAQLNSQPVSPNLEGGGQLWNKVSSDGTLNVALQPLWCEAYDSF